MYRSTIHRLVASTGSGALGLNFIGASDRLPAHRESPTADTGAPGLFARTHYRRNLAASSMGASSSDQQQGSSVKTGATSNGPRNAAPKSYAEAAAGPVYAPGSAVHLYANKENAWDGYTDDRYYGAKRLKLYAQRIFKDRGVKYYFLGVLLLMAVASAKLLQMQQEITAKDGLIGPKKKHYRSRLTVVLDVDETILSYGDKAFRMRAGLVARPYLAELLDYLASIDAEVILWSACSERYMRQVLGVIDPNGIRVSQYIVRSREWFTQDNYYEKNLLWLKRPMEDTIMIENRALSARNCNANVLLVDDFIRGEYVDTGHDYPPNDHALRTVREVIEDLEKSGQCVQAYFQNAKERHPAVKEIACHLAIRQLPDEIARGVFYFTGDKYRPATKVATK